MRELTAKQRAFARLRHEGKTQRDAYRLAFECKPDRDVKRIDEDARRLSKDPRIIGEIARLAAESPRPPTEAEVKKAAQAAAPEVARQDSAVVLPFPVVLDSPAVVPAKADAPAAEEAAPPPRVPAAQPLEAGLDIAGKARHSKEWFLALLEVNVARALQVEPVLDSRGNPTGEYVYAGAVANKAIELMAKIEGVLVEKRHVTVSTLDELPIEEIRRRREEVRRQLAIERGEDVEDIEFKEA